MTFVVTHRDVCRLCGSKDVQQVVKLNPVPLAEKYTDTAQSAPLYPIDFYMCRNCSHVQLLDVINSEHLWDDYTYHSGQTKGILDHFQEVSENIIKEYKPTPKSLVIDIGSNDGSLLRFFKNAGYRVHGIDPAKEIAKKASASGIETTPSLFTLAVAKEIREKYGKASVITAFNVFAHADNLGEMADAIRYLLDEQGIFVFEVQYLLDIVDKVLLGTIFHEHMSHHSLISMMKFLDRHDLQLIHVQRVSIQKGSLIGIVQRKGGTRAISNSVHDLLQLEKERHLDQLESMKDFGRRIEQNKVIASQLMNGWKEQKLTVAGYGAARSGPTLMMQFGFHDVIQYIFDDHPQKVHRFSPPDGIPVIPTEELLKRKPDVVIILAWIHARSIIEKSQQYLNEGGKFVVCTPDVRVITKENPA